MKTAIFIPDDIFKAVEEAARELRLSRSALFVKAMEVFLREYRSQRITKALNEIFGDGKESNSLDPVLARLQAMALSKERWE